ncbi:MAG: tRNA (guanine(46)-N(7))-methyltransferase TrmB [Planctomycetota bacterium]
MIEQSSLPPFEQVRIDPRSWFEHPERRFEIEIGSGKGTFLVQQAPLQPSINYLGIEWARAFCHYAADRLVRRGIGNARMLHADAVEFLHFWCADAVADVIHVYFSDPWPKKRHFKRRVIQDRSLEDLHRVLRPNGELRLVTDHASLWAWYEQHADRHAARFERRPFAAPESAGAGELVGTNYERKFAREGRPFYAMVLVKIP